MRVADVEAEYEIASHGWTCWDWWTEFPCRCERGNLYANARTAKRELESHSSECAIELAGLIDQWENEVAAACHKARAFGCAAMRHLRAGRIADALVAAKNARDVEEFIRSPVGTWAAFFRALSQATPRLAVARSLDDARREPRRYSL